MFTPEERARIRSELLELAAKDKRISGVAITGSVAADREDRWSDIDLAFGVGDANDIESVMSDFTAHMNSRYRALHHLDVKAGAWTYRVFFVPGTLQVDLAFVTGSEFRPLGATFKLVSGRANLLQTPTPPSAIHLIGMAWLHALHARSCIARGKLWQAEYMVGVVRNHALMLGCIRLGLPLAHGRGFDALPAEIKEPLLGSLVGVLETAELWSALDLAIHGLLSEARYVDREFVARIEKDVVKIAAVEARRTLQNDPC